MPASRRHLFVLVLACVSGVVLVQVALDWKSSGTGIFTLYNDSSNGKGSKTFVGRNSSGSEIFIYSNYKQFNQANKTHNTTKSNLKASTAITKILRTVTKTPVPPRRNEDRGLSFGRSLAQQKPVQQMVSRQDRLKELLKQTVVHKGPTLDPMRALKPIPLVDSDKVVKIFILTYFRSGSSFIGDILQQNWKTFYHFEPFHAMTYNNLVEDEKMPQVNTLLNDILNCNFTKQPAYMDWVKQPRNQFLFAHNLFLWVTCHSNPKTCFNATFVNAVCKRAPVHVVKMTRLRMRQLRSYLEDNGDQNIKVVFLTRDPRGILSSRWLLDWCNGTNCSDPTVLCNDMDEDIRIFKELKRQQPKNFIKIRYEDLSLNPEIETQKLFQHLQLPFSPSVKKFLKTHTVTRKNDFNPYSTRRNSTAMVFKWRERITFNQVLYIQSQCEEVLHKLNHSLITSPDELPYPNGKSMPKVITQYVKSEKKSTNLRKRQIV